MLLEPKKVEPGAAMRWLKEVNALVGVNFHIWFATALLISALAVMTMSSPFSGLICLILGLWAIKVSQEIAVRAEHGQATIRNLGSMLYEATKASIPDLQRQPAMVILLTSVSIMNLFDPMGSKTLQPVGSLVEMLFHWEALEKAVCLYFLGVVANQGGLFSSKQEGAMLVYPLQRMHDLTFEQAKHLALIGAKHNFRVMVLFDIAIMLIGLSLLAVPVLLPCLLVLSPALSYVACREIFGPGGKPQSEIQTSVLKPVLEN